MLNNGFVFGLLDDTLKERLICENELNLTKAVEIAQRQESSEKQMKDMSSKASINAMSKGHRPQHNLRHGNNTKFICHCCGNQHQPKHCPAYGQTCTRCTKPNHFAKMCRTKLVQTKTLEKGKHRHPKEVHLVEEQDTQSDLESDSSDDN